MLGHRKIRAHLRELQRELNAASGSEDGSPKKTEPCRVATGEMCQNRVMFKQFLEAGALDVLQIDSCRIGGVNEILAVYLMVAVHNERQRQQQQQAAAQQQDQQQSAASTAGAQQAAPHSTAGKAATPHTHTQTHRDKKQTKQKPHTNTHTHTPRSSSRD